MPPRRKVNRPGSNRSGQRRHGRSRPGEPFVHLLRLGQRGPAAESQGRYLLSEHAGFLRVHCQSLRLRLQRLGIGNIPQKRSRFLAQPEHNLEKICANCRRPNADVFGAQCSYDAGTVPNHRGARALLSEGVLSQRLHQEPEATRPFLQHARRV